METQPKKADALLEKISEYCGCFNIEEIPGTVSDVRVIKIKASAQRERNSLKCAPMLLKADETTNFIYKISGLIEEQAREINSIDTKSKIKDKMKKLRKYGGSLEYVGMNHRGFKRNLN